jgi:hypothetical protein
VLLSFCFIFLFGYYMFFDSSASITESVETFFDTNEHASVVSAKDSYECSVFYDTGSKAYLDAIYGSSSYCNIEKDGTQYQVTCTQGVIPKDLSECEVLEQW